MRLLEMSELFFQVHQMLKMQYIKNDSGTPTHTHGRMHTLNALYICLIERLYNIQLMHGPILLFFKGKDTFKISQIFSR